ncbi:MAG: type II toxin-antitoxin system VapC family toxin [Oscillatoriales cyanobacterium RM1_1_9]|nr:type II toxin-antitoxin system VapC family toxin [Oscillatoriales cyanobacterium SM2_3_0]NJO47510.1 type II toxin-antitoxin system VapC family toxin [Oscillatoriales cyanobacterium RM2_1_1]NJO71715.1 type II toxin-antitoxin system VapC family toxin [Oscillatoriales cyanobacterium RM1_1_9]
MSIEVERVLILIKIHVYLLDTNICIALIKKNPTAVSEFMRRIQSCYLSTVVISELYKFDLRAASEFGRIQAELRKIGRPTGELDAMIAAVARSQQLTLVTDNTRHFENITDLILENWLVDR